MPDILMSHVSTGKLIGIDDRDGIVKMDLNLDIKIIDMPSLAVYLGTVKARL